MIRSLIINKYLVKEFIKTIAVITVGCFCLGFIMNLFEEINFFKDTDAGIYLPIMMTTLFVPTLLYNMFPFIVFLSGIWFFLKIKKSDEVTAMKVFGLSNFSIIAVPGFIAIFLGIFFVTSVNPITSVLIMKYETIKGEYERDLDYLAAITENGIWIKEKRLNINTIIRSSHLENENLMEVTIYEFDEDLNFLKRIEAESANINTFRWDLKNTKIIDNQGKTISDNLKNFSYVSAYDLKKIKSLYSNLDTISFWSIEDQIRLLEDRGYSTREMETKLHRSFAFPFFLLSMILLSGVFTLGTNIKENNSTYIFIAIVSCVIIYFFNDLSSVLGETEKLPVNISVWMPILIIFIFSSVGVIHANQK